MRYIASLIGLVIAIGPAHAADHNARISEIMLSGGGSTANQFIELRDSAEPFPSQPYRLEVYDAAGTLVGSVSLTVPQNTAFTMLIARGTVGATADVALTVALPADGQACFVSTANTYIHCVAWGCVTTPINATIKSRAPAPPDGQSAQMQIGGLYLLATPTPDAVNATAGTSGPACPTDPPDAGPFADDIGPIDGPPSSGPDAGNNNNNGDGDGCCSTSTNPAGTFVLALFVALSAFASRRRRRP